MSTQIDAALDTTDTVMSEADPAVALRELPRDAVPIAKKYVDHLHLHDLGEPLTRFLTSVAHVNGLDGVGVALWEMPNLAPMLAIYILSDLSKDDIPGAPSPDTAAAELYADLRRHVSALAGRPLRLSLWSMNSAGGSFDDMVALYPTRMRDLVADEHAPGKLSLPADLTVFRGGALTRAA